MTNVAGETQSSRADLWAQRLRPPERVLTRELDGEAVLLNLDSGQYFGLDKVGTRMWAALSSAPSIEAAFTTLCGIYDVEASQLKRDLKTLIEALEAHGLAAFHDA